MTIHNHAGAASPLHIIHALPTHPGNAVSDPGAVAVWPPVRRPNIHGVTFDDVRVELRVSGPWRPRLGPDAVKSSRNYQGTSGHYTPSESRAAAAPAATAAPARETRGRTPPTNKSGSYAKRTRPSTTQGDDDYLIAP